MPRGIKGSGPYAGRGNKAKGRGRVQTLRDIAARSGSGQSASNGQSASAAPAAPAVAPPPASATTGRGRGRGRTGTTPKSNARRGTGKANGNGQRGNNGQQRAGDQPAGNNTGNGGTEVVETGGVKIEVMAVPGRGGRPQQSEAFPFAALEVAEKTNDGLVGPSFLIPDDQNPDNVLAAARKRHKGKTFTARKMEGGVRIWRVT